jgi:hypothetical protein
MPYGLLPKKNFDHNAAILQNCNFFMCILRALHFFQRHILTSDSTPRVAYPACYECGLGGDNPNLGIISVDRCGVRLDGGAARPSAVAPAGSPSRDQRALWGRE